MDLAGPCILKFSFPCVGTKVVENELRSKGHKTCRTGAMNIEYAESQMGALLEIKKRFSKEKPFKGLYWYGLHVNQETAVLVRTSLPEGRGRYYRM